MVALACPEVVKVDPELAPHLSVHTYRWDLNSLKEAQIIAVNLTCHFCCYDMIANYVKAVCVPSRILMFVICLLFISADLLHLRSVAQRFDFDSERLVCPSGSIKDHRKPQPNILSEILINGTG